VDIVFKGRRTGVPERFRQQASIKLAKIEKLDQKLIRIDVEISQERNPRQAGRRERVELTITHRGPAIRAEAAADDRYAALDLAIAKLESRLRRANDRRNVRNCDHASVRLMAADAEALAALGGQTAMPNGSAAVATAAAPVGADDAAGSLEGADPVVPIEMEGDGPLVVREKSHKAGPMTIDEALFEMELVGHDFFLFRDAGCGHASVVYRRRGYDYGVIRLIEG
jgi:ribosomal subunit interface protein